MSGWTAIVLCGDAVRRGATCVVVHRDLNPSAYGGATVVKVRDTLRALGDLAHYRRETYRPKVLAITGSNGKTTTKEMIAAILEEAYVNHKPLRRKILKTEGNFNNLVGFPLTLLRLRKRNKVAVVELGTNRPGEIERLTEIAAPDMGIITAVAAAHLEGLKSVAGVAHEKGALFGGIRPGGWIAVNLDDPGCAASDERFRGKKIIYGSGGQVRAESWRSLGAQGTMLDLQAGRRRSHVRLHFLGKHNIVNATGAAAMAYGFGISLAAIRRGLQKAKPFPLRMQLETWRKIGIINDAYNANPASMEAAVKTLARFNATAKEQPYLATCLNWAGTVAEQHLRLGKQVARAGIDRLYLLGAQAEASKAGCASGRHGGRANRYRQRSCRGCKSAKKSCGERRLATVQRLTRHEDGNGPRQIEKRRRLRRIDLLYYICSISSTRAIPASTCFATSRFARPWRR